MVMEFLSHRTPPSCISQNVLTVASILSPNFKVVHELFGVSFLRQCRSSLAYFTKLGAAFVLALEEVWLEWHGDGTKRRQIDIQNSVVRIAKNGGFITVCLDLAVIPEDETAVLLSEAMLRTFREARARLAAWRRLTEREYPDRPDLLEMIPKPADLSETKLARGGFLMTDTSTPARAFRRGFADAIREIARREGMADADIKVFELNCWHHLRNVWFGRSTLELGQYLENVLKDDMEKIHYSLRITTDVVGLLRAIEKYFGGTANYAKGKGLLFMDWMRRFHPTAYLFSIVRVCCPSYTFLCACRIVG